MEHPKLFSKRRERQRQSISSTRFQCFSHSHFYSYQAISIIQKSRVESIKVLCLEKKHHKKTLNLKSFSHLVTRMFYTVGMVALQLIIFANIHFVNRLERIRFECSAYFSMHHYAWSACEMVVHKPCYSLSISVSENHSFGYGYSRCVWCALFVHTNTQTVYLNNVN